MKRNTHVLFTCLVVLTLLSCTIHAQIAPGDLVLSSQQGIFFWDWTQASPRFLKTMNCSAITNYPGNWVACVLETATGKMYELSRTGGLKYFRTIPVGGQDFALDQERSLLVANPSTGVIYRTKDKESLKTFATIKRPNCICRNLDTGNFLVGTGLVTSSVDRARIIELNREDGSTFRVLKDLGPYAQFLDIAFLPRTGNLLVSYHLSDLYGAPDKVYVAVMDQNGSIVSSINMGKYNLAPLVSIAVDQARDKAYMTMAHPNYNSTTITEFTDSGQKVQSKTASNITATGIEIWGDQYVTADTEGKHGAWAYVYLRFPQKEMSGASYYAAIATYPRSSNPNSGLVFDGQRVNLRTDDWLFFYSLMNIEQPYMLEGWMKNFKGLLDSQGAALAHFSVPYLSPGYVVCVSAVAIKGSIVVGNTACIKVQ